LRLGQFAAAAADYDAALRLDPGLATALYGRGLAKVKSGDADGGGADMAAAKAIAGGIADEFSRYGIP
jgi:hypothetical protein